MSRQADHLRHHLARRRAVARRLDDQGREAAHRPPARAAEGRRHRGRLRGLVATATSRRCRPSPTQSRTHRLLAGTRQRPRHLARGRGAQGRHRARIHTFIATSASAHGEEAAHDARPGVRAGAAVGALRAQPVRRRRVLARGRLPLRPGLPVPRARGGDRRGRDHHQHSRHRGLRRAASCTASSSATCASACPTPTRRSGRCTATTTWAWRWPTRWPA